LIIELDSFRSGEFSFIDPIYELPWPSFFVSYFYNFEVEKQSFGILYSFAEGLPIFKTLQRSISFQISTTVIIPPTLGVLSDVGEFHIFILCIIYFFGKVVDSIF